METGENVELFCFTALGIQCNSSSIEPMVFSLERKTQQQTNRARKGQNRPVNKMAHTVKTGQH